VNSARTSPIAPRNPASPYDIFVSYARRDERYAAELREHLKGLRTTIDFNVFLDKEELRAGDDLKHKIDAALRSSSIFIIVATPYYFASDWAFPKEFPRIKETAERSGKKKRIITLVYEECDFLLEYHRLKRYLFEDFSKTRKRRYNKLIADLYKLLSENGA